MKRARFEASANHAITGRLVERLLKKAFSYYHVEWIIRNDRLET